MIFPIINAGVYSNYTVRSAPRVSGQREPEFRNACPDVDYNTAQALRAQQLVSFKQNSIVKSKKITVNIDLKDYPVEPQGSIDITPNKKIQAKQGIFPVYSMALNDSLVDEGSKISGIKTLHSDIKPNRIKLYLKSDSNDFNKVMNTVDSLAFDSKLAPKRIEEAKQLASVALFLNRREGDFPGYFKDIPDDMPEAEYEKLISDINVSDVLKYGRDITDNSNINVNLTLNKDFYNKNKDSINLYINKWGA